MEEQVNRLVEKTWRKSSQITQSSRILIAISGIPGSGKTHLAAAVSARLNTLHHQSHHANHPNSPGSLPAVPDLAAALPLDGYHLTRAQLSALPNAEEAHYRRGAAFTFDGAKYLELVKRLRDPITPESQTLYAPSFDHAIKDPVENDIAIPTTTRVVLLEGNYTALDEEPWREAARMMDELWFVEVDFSVAEDRLVKRHVAAGISADEDHARERARASDLRNGREIVEKQLRIDEVVSSVEDSEWRPGGEAEGEVEGEIGKEEVPGAVQRPPVARAGTSKGSIAAMAAAGVGL
ncbi:MAG: hypothetical protein Q9227_006618 [Pyrenula ochraceoflavens]